MNSSGYLTDDSVPSPYPRIVNYRGRFAPSPTGPLHFGSLLAAFGSWLLARQARGQWLVRIEDIDPPREAPGAAVAQLATLEAFGLRPDGPVMRQSERGPHYQAAMEQLLRDGAAFACACSRSDLAAQQGIHHVCLPGAHRARSAVRLRVPPGSRIAFQDRLQGTIQQDVYADVGDFVLRRADGYWAYQLAVVVDDAAQGITDVVRGADLLDSTPRQILLQRALGLPVPRYLHLPLALDGEGRKLSKSSAAVPLDDAEPMPALRAAWSALGQETGAMDGVTDSSAFLERAIARFQSSLLPTRIQPGFAASHNGFALPAD